MKLFRRLIALIVLFFCVYFFWLWIQQQRQTIITQTTTSIVTQLQSVKKLESATMTITKIIEGEDNLTDLIPGVSIDNMIQNFLFKDKIVLEVEGKIIAGFDLAKVTGDNIRINSDKSITIILPPAEILHAGLTESTKPFERNLGLLTKGNTQMETEIRNRATDMIKTDAIKAGILKQAELSAKDALSNLLKSVGVNIRDVIINNPID